MDAFGELSRCLGLSTAVVIRDFVTDIARKEVEEAKLGGFHLYSDAQAEADVKRLGRELDAERAAHAETRKKHEQELGKYAACYYDREQLWSRRNELEAELEAERAAHVETRKELEAMTAAHHSTTMDLNGLAFRFAKVTDELAETRKALEAAQAELADIISYARKAIPESEHPADPAPHNWAWQIGAMGEDRRAAYRLLDEARAKLAETRKELESSRADANAFGQCITNIVWALGRSSEWATPDDGPQIVDEVKRVVSELAETKAKLAKLESDNALRDIYDTIAAYALRDIRGNQTSGAVKDGESPSRAVSDSAPQRVPVDCGSILLTPNQPNPKPEPAMARAAVGPGAQPPRPMPPPRPEPAKCTCVHPDSWHDEDGCRAACPCTWDGQS